MWKLPWLWPINELKSRTGAQATDFIREEY
jgi:hypothetical protein